MDHYRTVFLDLGSSRPELAASPQYGDIQVLPYSATRWNPEDLTGAAEEIEITVREWDSLWRSGGRPKPTPTGSRNG